MKKFEYKFLDKDVRPTLKVLNEQGALGWIIIDRSYGTVLMMRETK